MKKCILLVAFLALPLSAYAAPQAECAPAADPAKEGPVVFQSAFVRLVDGTPLIEIEKLMRFAKEILALINGAQLKLIKHLQVEYKLEFPEPVEKYVNESGKIGIIWFKNNYRTLKWLRAYEKQNPHDADIKDALNQACKLFIALSEDYIVEIEAAKSIMVEIINEWCQLRNKPNSVLLEWADINGNERDALFKNMTEIEIFDNFVNDLLLFLKDLITNCPKSYEKYQEKMKMQSHGAHRAN